MPERDANGKFVKGNGGGPGRPRKEREERYYEIMVTTVTFDDWKAIIKKATTQAKRGNAIARKWLGDYLIGTAIQRIEHTGAEGRALQVILTWGNNDNANGNPAESA